MISLSDKIFVLDGAMGTMIQKYSLMENDYRGDTFSECRKELKGNNECLNLTRPDIIKSIHCEYIEAGADIIETNTFSANRISQSEYGCEEFAGRMAFEGARLAREVADEYGRKVWVAGSVGPTSKSLSLSPDVSDPAFRVYSFEQMRDAYQEQIEGLVKGGADLILIEKGQLRFHFCPNGIALAVKEHKLYRGSIGHGDIVNGSFFCLWIGTKGIVIDLSWFGICVEASISECLSLFCIENMAVLGFGDDHTPWVCLTVGKFPKDLRRTNHMCPFRSAKRHFCIERRAAQANIDRQRQKQSQKQKNNCSYGAGQDERFLFSHGASPPGIGTRITIFLPSRV